MFRKCSFGGSSACKNQGGDGSTYHKDGYYHPFTSAVEHSISDPVFPLHKSIDGNIVDLVDLEFDFDDDVAKSLLSLDITSSVNEQDLVSKALYDLDLDSDEGIRRILELLPILDPEILKVIYTEIFPGYQVEKISPRMLRIEIRGYLLDALDEAPDERRDESVETGPDTVPEESDQEDQGEEDQQASTDESGTEAEPDQDVAEQQPTG